MDTKELLSEPQAADLETRAGFLSGVGRAAKDVLDWYFEPRDFERDDDGRIYHYLGVHYFKKIVPTGGTYINRLLGISYKEQMKDKTYLKEFEKLTRFGEAGHDLGLLGMVYAITYNIQEGNIKMMIFSVIANIMVNGYGSMLQRYNRARIYNTLDKLESMEDRK